MKKLTLQAVLCLSLIAAISGCGPKCAKCHAEVLGIKSPDQEYCGDDLKKVKEQPGVVCDDK